MAFDLHPEMAPLIAERDKLPPATEIADIRRNWAVYSKASWVPPPAGMKVEDRTVKARDGHAIPVRVYTPAGGGSGAGVSYFHGGGFVKGDPDSSDTTGWGLAAETGAVTVSVDYRLAPENKYPTALNDCVDVVIDMHTNPKTYGVDPTRLGVVGDSAGGNLAAATALWARQNGKPALRCQGLIYPCLTDRLTAPAYARNAEAPGLTTASMRGYWRDYLGEEKAGHSTDPLATPLVADDLSGLPPAYVLVAEHDPLIDDGIAYAQRLIAAGVETGFSRANRMIHGFIRRRTHGPDCGRAFSAMTEFLRTKLDG
ncbi:MAG: alpha/beta hydrolase [Hyphomicrobiaceae bacterium]